ncbi:MAG TPA: acetolactate synthase small subunit [Aquifex aeolicus]|uniref:Acetolactate synthase small subunit n=1 Tax=Aquifex aeolicus TaxID=63363 RepID=A0A9D0YNS1_AQUAO|nr:acetolactate synthase small subunit [Aquificales bacterium]HIP98133.1 acetolactate synthase small subunit [Aquifex aeolicus]HIQ26013.1 acetolactate synthase small subunit [Aquifex aeolicus]
MADTIGRDEGLKVVTAPKFRKIPKGKVRKHVIDLIVQNEHGVLSRIVTLIAGKGYNIESLSVGETHEKGLSRMTIVVEGDQRVIEQVVKQLRRLISTIKVRDLTDLPHIERELLLVKVNLGSQRAKDEVFRLAQIFGGKIVDVSPSSYTIELSGDGSKISTFIELVKPFGIKEMIRTGKIALKRDFSEAEEEG